MTLLAAGKDLTRSERGFVHKTVGVMMDTITATLGHTLSGYKLLHLLPRDQAQIGPQGLPVGCRNSHSELLD